MTRETIVADDGLRLEVRVGDGPADGALLISHTGTPSSGRLYGKTVAAGAERGIRIVSYARPGYSESDRREGRSVADCVADVAAIADHLGAERFYVTGGSGGGPHALACAAHLPDRVLATASIAGCAPYPAEGVDWLAGMGDENIEEFGLALQGADALRPWLEEEARQMAAATPAELRDVLGTLVSDADREVLTGEFAEHMHASFLESAANGVWGWLDDDLAFTRPWGFDVGAIETPVTVWHGGQDRFVPIAHGEWLVRHVSGADARLLPEHGHMSLAIAHYGAILDDLIAKGQR